ncbi:hypothetical protein MYCTH_2308206 [Thermothelomyces thermophilus ATCC 42464]|uniref:Uncharacterized protein n=1 Tax=Thermothelomyces thermophilus (strain ATCC 42464 / BCRC 31852 / DSM 1799) TaxID=573729 RepID=G2QJF8_THET4|nr:uncharacterized protein MYCTH_2308206 [Thermothelomyces thermophilus ATCC 42464]AEO59715.1 hypothetical protein MYCTH_2308206 [Thermothelomyces thermophilus ATCC 42464]
MIVPESLLSCFCGAELQHQPENHHCGNNLKYTLINEKPGLEPVPSTAATPRLHPACPYLDGNDNKNDDDDELTRRADRILTVLLTAPRPADPSEADLTSGAAAAAGLRAQDWTSYLAERVLHALERKLGDVLAEHSSADRSGWGGALADAYDYAVELIKRELRELWEYAKAHPYETAATVLLTLVSLGVLARLLPLIVRALGFGELGPIEGSFAAWWQRLYGGYVPKGSLWSFLQRMGMTWK